MWFQLPLVPSGYPTKTISHTVFAIWQCRFFSNRSRPDAFVIVFPLQLIRNSRLDEIHHLLLIASDRSPPPGADLDSFAIISIERNREVSQFCPAKLTSSRRIGYPNHEIPPHGKSKRGNTKMAVALLPRSRYLIEALMRLESRNCPTDDI